VAEATVEGSRQPRARENRRDGQGHPREGTQSHQFAHGGEHGAVIQPPRHQRADHRTHARARHRVHRDAALAQGTQHAQLRKGACPAAAQGEADAAPQQMPCEPLQVASVVPAQVVVPARVQGA